MSDPIEDIKQRIEKIRQFVSPQPVGGSFIQQLQQRARSQQPPIQPPQVVSPPSDVGKKFLKGAAKFAKDITLTLPARAAASLTLETLQRPEYKPETKFEKFVLGEEPIKAVGEIMEEAIPKGAAIGRRLLGRPGEIAGAGLAPFVVAAGTLIDLAPFGGTKKGLEKALLNSKTIGEAAEHLAKAGIPRDLIETYAPKFAEATKIEEVKSGLKSLGNVLKTTKAEVSAGVKAIPQELEPLAKEARKYKSAEEFVRGIRNKLNTSFTKEEPSSPILENVFKTLSPEEQRELFTRMPSRRVYDKWLRKNSH